MKKLLSALFILFSLASVAQSKVTILTTDANGVIYNNANSPMSGTVAYYQGLTSTIVGGKAAYVTDKGAYYTVVANTIGGYVQDSVKIIFTAAGQVLQRSNYIIRNVIDYNADPTGATDSWFAIMKCANQMYADFGGGTVYFPAGSFKVSRPLLWPPNVSMQGQGNEYNGATTISALSGWSGPVWTNDTTRGTVLGTGDDGTPQRATNIIISGIKFVNTTGTTWDADAIRLHNAWTVVFDHVGALSNYGFVTRVLDCNALNWTNTFFSGTNYHESTADFTFSNAQWGPNDFPTVDNELSPTTLWINQGAKGHMVNMNIYNAGKGFDWAATLTANSPNITITAHGLTEGTPLNLVFGGAIPSTFPSERTTVFVHVVDANTINIAKTRLNFRSSTWETPTTTGSSVGFRIGDRANMYMNNASDGIDFSSVRFDQGYYAGVKIRNSTGLSFAGCHFRENGRANATGQPGVWLLDSANVNAFNGCVWRNQNISSATGTSNQTVGMQIDATSRGTQYGFNQNYGSTLGTDYVNNGYLTIDRFTPITINYNLLPDVTNTRTLGSSSLGFGTVWSNNFSGTGAVNITTPANAISFAPGGAVKGKVFPTTGSWVFGPGSFPDSLNALQIFINNSSSSSYKALSVRGVLNVATGVSRLVLINPIYDGTAQAQTVGIYPFYNTALTGLTKVVFGVGTSQTAADASATNEAFNIFSDLTSRFYTTTTFAGLKANGVLNYTTNNGKIMVLQNDSNMVSTPQSVIVGTLARSIQSGNGSTTTFSIAHGLTGITTTTPVQVTAQSVAASGSYYVTTDATNINIIYATAPVSGASNLTWSYYIKP